MRIMNNEIHIKTIKFFMKEINMQKDPALEEISDRIRMGIPVSLMESIAAIDYQEKLREHRNIISRFIYRCKNEKI